LGDKWLAYSINFDCAGRVPCCDPAKTRVKILLLGVITPLFGEDECCKLSDIVLLVKPPSNDMEVVRVIFVSDEKPRKLAVFGGQWFPT
jgi:hypothetical protein